MKQTIEIEGLPEGWKAVAYRCPLKGEQYLHQNQLWKAFIDESYPFIVVEKTQPRRIVLEETGKEVALTVTIEGYLYGYINKDGFARYKILREVKE